MHIHTWHVCTNYIGIWYVCMYVICVYIYTYMYVYTRINTYTYMLILCCTRAYTSTYSWYDCFCLRWYLYARPQLARSMPTAFCTAQAVSTTGSTSRKWPFWWHGRHPSASACMLCNANMPTCFWIRHSWLITPQSIVCQAGRQAGMIGFITLQQSAPSQMTLVCHQCLLDCMYPVWVCTCTRITTCT